MREDTNIDSTFEIYRYRFYCYVKARENVSFQNSTNEFLIVKKKFFLIDAINILYAFSGHSKKLECYIPKFFTPSTMVAALTNPLSNVNILPPLALKFLPPSFTLLLNQTSRKKHQPSPCSNCNYYMARAT